MNIKLLYGLSTALPPTKVNGRLLFCTDTKEIYFDIEGGRIKLYDSLDTAKTNIDSLKTLVGSTAVATQISSAIDDLKKTIITEKEDSNSVTITISDNADASAKKIKAEVKVSAESGNQAIVKNDGIFVPAPSAPDTYTVKKASTADTGFAATYQLYKVASGGTETAVGDKINIAKDFLVKSATIETVTTADDPYTGAIVGNKYIDFVINTKEGTDTAEHLYLAVNELVDVYDTGSAAGDMVVIAVSSDNKITAEITDSTITKDKLVTTVQTTLDKADKMATLNETAETNKYVSGISVGADGTVTVTKGVLPDVNGLEWGTFASTGT